MPKLISLYIRHVLIGFGLAAVFVALLLWTNVGNLWHLVSTSDVGVMAVIMLFMGNGIVFSGVQFAITVMRMGDDDEPRGGKRIPVATNIPARVEATATAPRKRQ
ncbi:hypothetical protein [Maritimibacter sp. UBA3975]|uniref:hypothetical protein n=1 Tax=Maritimibacter sp. UBA3975 TaxID=1946833 RepID=UPI000C09AB14|nr:hypothetical protein [Maritimibacter sp. UBA3975]MAM61021.1 hypothetical protein [Maritimibacter sp.]|tara:strand:+ start:21279 stop:21593 length:315 start_codon:yes stop_codon:yes gene_type:complete